MFLQLRYLLFCLRKKYAQGKIFTLLLSVIGRYFSCKGFPAINTIVILMTEVVGLKHLVLKYCLSKPLLYNYYSFWPSYTKQTGCSPFLFSISEKRTNGKYLFFRWKIVNSELLGDRYKPPFELCLGLCVLYSPSKHLCLQRRTIAKKHSSHDPITFKAVRPQGDKGIAWRCTGVSQTDGTFLLPVRSGGLRGWALQDPCLPFPGLCGAWGAGLSPKVHLSCQICGNTSKPEEREGSVEIVQPKIVATFSHF